MTALQKWVMAILSFVVVVKVVAVVVMGNKSNSITDEYLYNLMFLIVGYAFGKQSGNN